MRKDFCEFLLDACPCLREYGNVTYRCPDVTTSGTAGATSDAGANSSGLRTSDIRRNHAPKIVGTVLVIDVPD